MSKINRTFMFSSLGAVALLWVFWAAREILPPFVLGIIFAYLFNPLVEKLVNKGLSRVTASLVLIGSIILSVAAFLVVILPGVAQDISQFTSKVPTYATSIKQQLVPVIDKYVDVPVSREQLAEKIGQFGGQAAKVTGNLLQQAALNTLQFIDFLMFLIITPIVMFYLIIDWPRFAQGAEELLPRKNKKAWLKVLSDIDRKLSAFLRGQGLVCLLLGLFYAAGLSLTGLQMGLIIGLLTGIFSFVPFLGMTAGVVIAYVVAFTQYQTTGIEPYAWIALVFVLGQFLEGYILSPRLVGKSLGLHPVWVIFATLAGGQIYGLTGVIIALPVAAILTVLVPLWLTAWHKSSVLN